MSQYIRYPTLGATNENIELLAGDIRNFGAIAGQDSSVAIQRAVDSIHTAGGGNVFIPEGTWYLGTVNTTDTDTAYSYIVPKPGVNIVGLGIGISILKVSSGQNLLYRGTTGPNIIATQSAAPLQNCTFSGITFDWNGANNLLLQPGTGTPADTARNNASIFSLNGGINILVENCEFKETPGDQCVFFPATSDLAQKNITIQNCNFVNNGSALTGNYCADHSSIYCNGSNLAYKNNKFYVTTGLTVNGTCFEIHGSNSIAQGNVGDSYDLGTWIASDYQAISNIELADNVFTGITHGFNLAGATYAIDEVRVLGNIYKERAGATYSSPTWFCNDGNTIISNSLLHIADNQFIGQSSSGTLRFMQLYKTAEFIFVNNRVEKFSNYGIQGAGISIGSSKFANTILINDNQFIDVVRSLYFNDVTLAVTSFNVNDNSFVRTSADANPCITLTASSSAGFIFDNFFSANYTTDFAGTPNGVIFGTGQDITLSAVGSSANANAATLTGQVLNLQPADGSNPGVITAGTQTFGGNKTFNGTINANNIASANVASTIVQRDGSGNFAASAITATTVTGLSSPSVSSDAANKDYVDTVASGLQPKEAAFAASTADIPGSYYNGVAGIGATFTPTATGAFSIDGTSPAINARILLKNQASGLQNGVYNLTLVGSLGISPILTRALNYNTADEIDAGDLIPVENGTANATTSWLQTASVTTVGTDALSFTQFTASPGSYLTKPASLVNHGVLIGTSSQATNAATAGTDGQLLIGQSSADPQFKTASGDATVAANGTVSLKATGTAGTYTKVTTDAQGRITSGTTLSGSDLPNPSASTLGGIKSLAAVTSKWINTISTSGVPSATQPASADISDAASANTASVLVLRDGSGNFSAGTITANLTGNASGTAATVTSAAQPSITSVGTLTAVTVSGLITANVASGSDSIKLIDGAHLNFSTADASAYLYRSASNTVRTPGTITADTTFIGCIQPKQVTLTWGASVAVDASGGSQFVLTATDTSTTPTIGSPTNVQSRERLEFRIVNSSGGTMAGLTFNADYRMNGGTAPTAPANGSTLLIEFEHNGAGIYLERWRSTMSTV